MTKKPEIIFAEPKQDRSKKTLDDLLEAALDLADSGDLNTLTSRSLSKKSGYSLGTLNKRLTSVDKIFLWAIKKGQEKHLARFAKQVDDFDPGKPLKTLLEDLIDGSFAAIKQVNPLIIRFYEERVTKFSRLENPHEFGDALVGPFLRAAHRDQTNTFRKMPEDELKFIARTMFIFIERPFVDLDPLAGTEEHRRIALDNFLRLLGK